MKRLESRIFNSVLLRPIPEKKARFLSDLINTTPPLNAETSFGFIRLRHAAQTALVQAIAELEGCDQIDTQSLRFATFSFIEGYTRLDEPLADLKRLNGRMDRLCRRFGLFAFLAPDIEVVYFEDINEYVLSYHAHGPIGAVNGGEIKPRLLTDAMNALPSSEGVLDRPASISDRRLDRTGIDNALRSSSYGLKVTARVKTVRYDDDGEPNVQSSISKFSGTHALRSLHAWSLLPILSNVQGIGAEGQLIRKAWKRKILAQLQARTRKGRKAPPASVAELSAAWDEFWSIASKQRRRSPKASPSHGLASVLTELSRGKRGKTGSVSMAMQSLVQRTSEVDDV